MGVASFLSAIWRGTAPADGRTVSGSTCSKLSTDSCDFSPCSSRKSGHVTFTLPSRLYSWLESMAVLHNYGSVHKSVRDLLTWAATGQPDDVEWMFSTPHHIPTCLDVGLCSDAREAKTIAEKQCRVRLAKCNNVTLDARLSDSLSRWIMNCVSTYNTLGGPSDVLEQVCKCAIVLGAADDIFESDETGHDLPTTTAELYHDLGIIGFAASPASSTASSPPPGFH